MCARSIYKSLNGEKEILTWYDGKLSTWPVRNEMVNIPTHYGNTFMIASGEESFPPLVLLHGAGTNSAMWEGEVAVYSRTHRVFAIDLLGEPGKSAPDRFPLDGPAYAEWLKEVLDYLNIKQTSIVGLSQGAWIALKFGVIYPERIQNLVLLSPGGIVPDKLSFIFRAIPLSLMGEWGIRKVNHMLAGDQIITKEVDDALTLIMTHFITRTEPLPIFTDQQLQCLNMPVLLLMGDKDALRDAGKIGDRLQNIIPHLESIIVPGGGHALMGTAERILGFLDGKNRS